MISMDSEDKISDNLLDQSKNFILMAREDGPPTMVGSSKRSFMDVTNGMTGSKEMITPPNSTVRKSGAQDLNTNGLKPPLSPALSSPIASRPKKQRSDGGGGSGSLRSNGNFTLQELLESLEKRRDNGELAKKPPYSYATLIGLAILQSALGKLTLSQIYNWISVHFPYYKQKDAGWQNSIRHNLSLNDAFIKAEKSNDGKGHFWQVNPGCETKFFKGETGTYEDVRRKLQNLDIFFGNSVGEQEQEDERQLGKNGIKNDGLAVPALYQSRRVRVSVDEGEGDSDEESDEDDDREESEESEEENEESDEDKDYDDEHKEVDGPQLGNDEVYNNSLLHIHSSPGAAPLHLKDINTRDSFPDENDDDKHNEFGSMKKYPDTVFSPQDFKKYSCSFNSSFGEASPKASRVVDEPLLDSNDFAIDEEHQQRQSPLENLPQTDLLKTPRASSGANYERTPMRFLTSPHDGSSSMKKWQTPSHLFEDLYCSPLFKSICTPMRDGLPSVSPRNAAAPDMMSSARRAKMSSSGLFGVDVYAVWKRATESTAQRNNDNGNNQRLGIPFKSTPSHKKDGHMGDVMDSDNKGR